MKAFDSHEQRLFDAGLRKTQHSYQGATRDVYRGGEGPPVIVLSEIPGITPPTIALCKRLMSAGYEVSVPQLIGEPGRAMSTTRTLAVLLRVCVSHEFELLATRKASPITEWLRSLARALHTEHKGTGVGVIGMCLTGGFALAMMVDSSVVAPVLSQPSLPLSVSPASACALGIAEADLGVIKARLKREDLSVLGLRFSHDLLAPGARFRRLHEELGDHFIAVEIDSRPFNAHGIKPWAHSVLTKEFVDDPGHPTRAAFDEVLALFARQLIVRNSSVAE